ncbi:MAG: sensor histidine kinase KdpD [Bacteroidetes bacterium]|nr:sensor histidine kinase KdpD [Bacteroidota bacterium]
MTPDRPDPDQLLRSIQEAAKSGSRGTLKIFFGMCAGVGKTYTMLEAAHDAQRQGIDVVVGLVETHGRQETERLLDGLPVVPRKVVEHRGTVLTEFDIDAVLSRAPQLVLVDELAHTNAPGSRHGKRFLDVLELLDRGISVYTTLNVQHLESRADAVAQITGFPIQETVPDSVFDAATEIELIDLPADSLLKRLHEGKVYTAAAAQRAINNFFRKGNLTALREMALRLTAEHVDVQLRSYMSSEHIAGPWRSNERILVAIGPAPSSAQLIRWARRMAAMSNTEWMVAYVDTGAGHIQVDEDRIREHLDLARELGAEVQTTASASIVQGILDIAQRENVTQIIVGKPKRRTWSLWRRTLVDVLIDRSGPIDVHTVRLDGPPTRRTMQTDPVQENARGYLSAVGVVLAIVAIGLVSVQFIGYQSIGLILMGAMVVLGMFHDRGPLLLAAIISAFLWNFLFIPPRFTLFITRPEDAMMIVLYLTVALVTGTLTMRLRQRERSMRTRETRTALLFSVAKSLSERSTMDVIVRTSVRELASMLQCEVAMYLRSPKGILEEPHPSSTFTPTAKDRSVAMWSFINNRMAGKFTDTLSSSATMSLPITGVNATHGVICFQFNDVRMSAEQQSLIESAVRLIALALDREVLVAQAATSEVARRSDELRTIILNSVSHELRTPLAVLNAAISTLRDESIHLTAEQQKKIMHDAGASTERLSRVVDHLLNMTRLESGNVRPLRQWCDVADLINSAIHIAAGGEVIVHKHIPASLPFLQADEGLLEQALVNVLENAVRYSPPDVPVNVTVADLPEGMSIIVRDSGPGVSPDDLEHLFEKFYRASTAKEGGTGLGLAIAKGFIEALNGTIEARLPQDGGLEIRIFLPLPRSTQPFTE